MSFSKAEQRRIADACMVLGIKPPELAHFAMMQVLDELEGIANEMRAIAAYYGNHPSGGTTAGGYRREVESDRRAPRQVDRAADDDLAQVD